MEKTPSQTTDTNTKHRLLIPLIATLVIVVIIGMIVGIELNRSNIERDANLLYDLENFVEEWKNSFDSEDSSAEEILSYFSEYSFRKGSYAENRKNYLLGDIYELLEEQGTAAEYFLQVARSARGYLAATALLKAAFLYEEGGDISQAQVLFLELVDKYDYHEEARVLFTLGRFAEQNEEYEEAYTFYSQIIDDQSSGNWTNFAYNRIIELKSLNKISD